MVFYSDCFCMPPVPPTLWIIVKASLSITSFSSSFRFGGQNKKAFGGPVALNQNKSGIGKWFPSCSDWWLFPSQGELCSFIFSFLLQIGVSGQCKIPVPQIKWLQDTSEPEVPGPCLAQMDVKGKSPVRGLLRWLHRVTQKVSGGPLPVLHSGGSHI